MAVETSLESRGAGLGEDLAEYLSGFNDFFEIFELFFEYFLLSRDEFGIAAVLSTPFYHLTHLCN